MEKRYACFELLTRCLKCGNLIPVNGPFPEITCPDCLSIKKISVDLFMNLFSEFDEEFQGSNTGQSKRGVIYGRADACEYIYLHEEPHCRKCNSKYPDYDPDTESIEACKECGLTYFVYPGPKEFTNILPSLKQIISYEKPEYTTVANELKTDKNELRPIVLSCPKCAGALSVTKMTERIMNCKYCGVDVYLPDPVWQQLHSVETNEKWFVRFEGKTLKQLTVERRTQELKEEMEEIKKQQSEASVKTKILMKPVASVPKKNLEKCKTALIQIAKRYDLEYKTSEYNNMGYIIDYYKGFEINIDPGSNYAIEIDTDRLPLYIKTELPADPNKDFYRFTTNDKRFDRIFPIRYTERYIVKKMEASEEYKAKFLAPFKQFLDRWESQLAVLKFDLTCFAVHLYPGWSGKKDSTGRYLEPEQIEPLLDDMVMLTKVLMKLFSE